MEKKSTFDRLHEFTGSFETRVGAVVGFGGEAHSCTVGAAGASFLVIARLSQPPRA